MTTVFADGKKVFLNPFMCSMIGNVVVALSKSLKTPRGNRIEFSLNQTDLHLRVDEQEVPLNLGHAQEIIGNILRGLIVSLKGAEQSKEFRFIHEEDTL
ncbi:MAG: hypothetical protein C5B54_08670 [Acidobacteria bacterium]|nr:MAG: hypothetical protein C5B54_08670 [Acidobacteriota bacterium]